MCEKLCSKQHIYKKVIISVSEHSEDISPHITGLGLENCDATINIF